MLCFFRRTFPFIYIFKNVKIGSVSPDFIYYLRCKRVYLYSKPFIFFVIIRYFVSDKLIFYEALIGIINRLCYCANRRRRSWTALFDRGAVFL